MGSGFIKASADRPAALIPDIESRLIEDLFHNAKGVVVATLVLYAINYTFYTTVLPLDVLLFWSSLMLGACVLRITSIWRYERFCELHSSSRWHNEMALPFVGAMSFCYLVVLNRVSARSHDTLVQNVTFGLQNETVDALTGLSNRRALNTSFQEAWASAELDGKSVGLILCDIDHFKEFNDKHGHLEGDRCLQQVAAALQSVTRISDLTAARYGGEEFAVLLPSCDPDELERVAERLRSAVQTLDIRHGKSSVSEQVTFSVGVSHLVPGSLTATDDLIRAADRALYKAKEGGRNLVQVDA